MEINHVVQIRPSLEENRSCAGRTHDEHKNLGRMESISIARSGVSLFPEVRQKKQTRNRKNSEAPHYGVRRPASYENQLISKSPKRSQGDRQQKNISRPGFGWHLGNRRTLQQSQPANGMWIFVHPVVPCLEYLLCVSPSFMVLRD